MCADDVFGLIEKEEGLALYISQEIAADKVA